ncbi:MAG: sigma-70 family RNA polymerase sigma factor [Sedimentisphaerales bacterium]|nr:sigma-70 family RNA polymerase sigma factor [Sedimentisphaerales bacterium]
MSKYTDEELMTFVKDRNISAFEELFNRYERRIFCFFYRLLWDVEEARDCTQETFLRLWRGRTIYAPKGRFTTYIFQIAKNHFLNEHERKRCRITFTHASRDDFLDSAENLISTNGSSEQAVANELAAAIGKAIADLPEPHRLVYILSEEQRFSYKEIADVLGCPVGTVSSRKVEAVRKLRKLLAPLREDFLGKDSHDREVSK